MIDQHGWTSKDWDELTIEQKAIQIASLQYWSNKRAEAREQASGNTSGKKVI